jgi:ribonucleoside-diphosphate reductase alpha chain
MTTTTSNGTTATSDDRPGLRLRRHFTTPDVDPYSLIDWELRTAAISDESGKVFFEQTNIEIPSFWSQTATQVVASKYFRGRINTPERESSARHLVDRIVNVLGGWGREPANIDLATGQRYGVPYFASEDEALTFENELRYILINQLACFNSPVWFNVGVREKPQCSACFILSVEDDMSSILDWCHTEGMIFKGGSGSGINLSTIRSSREYLSGGGIASGPVSFMRGADAIAGSIKSGGTTRRAAKMVILNADHPDVFDFIECKAREEKKAYDLGSAGWDMSLNGEAWASVQFQNANNSVRATDDFMQAAINGGPWELRAVTTGEIIEIVNARDVLHAISKAAWECGDPGMQFDTTINDWHTCANTARINGSNPCSEYMHVDNSACNLSSINLLRFLRTEGATSNQQQATGSPSELVAGSLLPVAGLAFDIDAYKQVVDIMITAQEIIVGHSGYPTPQIEANAHAMRQLGLGYANLGATLMSLGLPYDSDAGRAYAAALTAIMTGRAYAQSANIASRVGAFDAYELNREPMLRVIRKHREAAYALKQQAIGNTQQGSDGSGPVAGCLLPVASGPELAEAATQVWDDALALGSLHGYRNAQATVLAPTGTIAFMMDCDTTGVEPDIALIKYKKLVGGGMLRIVNQTVPRALAGLGYDAETIEGIVAYIDAEGTIEGAPGLKDEHLPVFDCAFRADKGVRSIAPMGHVKMMGAIQPFISGAISKTVNVPNEATVEDIVETYIESWKHGVKAIAIYRDGSKAVQPLSTSKDSSSSSPLPPGEGQGEGLQAAIDAGVKEALAKRGPTRRRLPDTRPSITHKFSIEGHEGYINVGMFDDRSPGEIFVTMAKEGSTLSGMMDAFATSISLTLQYGVPLRDLVQKFSHMRFEPMGRTENREIPVAQSIVDYIFRWLASQFLTEEDKRELGILTPAERARLEAQYSGVQPELLPAPAAPIAAVVNLTPSVPLSARGEGEGGEVLASRRDELLPVVESAYRGPRVQADAPTCASCGWIMSRSGTCYRCENCGSTSGCS